MKYLHTMIRVQNLERALDFFINKLGMTEVRRKEVPEGEVTLIFLAATNGCSGKRKDFSDKNVMTFLTKK